MNATGIIRRVDDMGRIVIPKELRKTIFGNVDLQGIPFEFFIDNDSVIIKKYKEESDEQPTETKELRCKVCNHSLDIRKDNTYKVNVTNQIFTKKMSYCVICGKEFEKRIDHGKEKKYCSRECMGIGKSPFLEYNGEKRRVIEWASITGIEASVILTRLKYGWDIEKILTTPTQIKNRGGKK